MPQISLSRLKTIINEELQLIKEDNVDPKKAGLPTTASESEKIKAQRDVLDNVVVLLKAIETFESKANSTLKDKLSDKLGQLKSELDHISKFPDQHIVGGKVSPAVSSNTLMQPNKKSIKPSVKHPKK